MEHTAPPDSQKLNDLVADNQSMQKGRRPTLAIKHFAVLTAFILPFTIVPYIITRRQISVLHRKLNEAGLTAVTFQGDLKRVLVEAARAKQDHAKVRALLGELKLDVERLREEAGDRESTRAAADDILRSDVWKLLEERKYARAHFANLRDLGTSLADIAGFMHEVELHQGLKTQGEDSRGISRLRLLALRMQAVPGRQQDTSTTATGAAKT